MRKGEWSAFGFKTMKKHYALLPLVAFTGAACVMCGSYVIFMATTKADLSWTPGKYSTNPPYKDIKPTEVKKFLNMHTLNPDAEVESLKREVASAYYK